MGIGFSGSTPASTRMCFDRVLATIQNLHGTRQFADSLIKLHGRRVSQITTYRMALTYMMGDLRFSPMYLLAKSSDQIVLGI